MQKYLVSLKTVSEFLSRLPSSATNDSLRSAFAVHMKKVYGSMTDFSAAFERASHHKATPLVIVADVRSAMNSFHEEWVGYQGVFCKTVPDLVSLGRESAGLFRDVLDADLLPGAQR